MNSTMKKDKSKKRVEKVKNDSSKEERKEPVEEKAPAEKETTKNEDDEEIITKTTFESLGVHEEICKATLSVGWTHASRIQKETLPHALAGRDIIGLAETGSGKTGAFVIPIFQALLENPQRNAVYAVILAPTRELAFQIHENAAALGGTIGATCVCIVGGVDSASQSIALARNPHIVTATPGRLVDHLTNTKGFSLRKLKYLVMDEADRMLRYVNKQLD
jgi:ATP-dependent RNA helicase DDX47/RRP3